MLTSYETQLSRLLRNANIVRSGDTFIFVEDYLRHLRRLTSDIEKHLLEADSNQLYYNLSTSDIMLIRCCSQAAWSVRKPLVSGSVVVSPPASITDQENLFECATKFTRNHNEILLSDITVLHVRNVGAGVAVTKDRCG